MDENDYISASVLKKAERTEPLTEAEFPIQISNLEKSFGSNHVLRKFNLKVKRGETVVVLGRSGSGKSVLIKCIVGLMEPDGGSMKLFGKDRLNMNKSELDKLRSRIGFLFQNNALYDSLSIRENLEFPLRRHKREISEERVNSMVMEALSDVGLEHTADMMPAELSGGMKKRIALARTLIIRPEILLYDEPTTGLDPITGREIIELMGKVQEKYQPSTIIISHDMNCVRYFGNHVAVLIDGICYAEGSYETLSRMPDTNVKAFFE